MRDIQQVLERWGAWVADNPYDVAWSHIAAGFKGVIPRKIKSRPQCCEDDAMIISSCVAKLNKNNRDIHDLIFEYYVFGKTFIQLARQYSCSDGHVGKKLQKAEGVIEGMLIMLNIKLEMDKFVQKN